MAKVDYLHHTNDLEVVVLGSMGLSTDCIVRRTGLSAGQVLYRLAKARCKRADYRNGTSPAVRWVEQAARVELVKKVRQQLAGGGSPAKVAKVRRHRVAS